MYQRSQVFDRANPLVVIFVDNVPAQTHLKAADRQLFAAMFPFTCSLA
jgi:hypothetical protein